MKSEKEYCCTGFKCLGLVPGTEVRIMEGVKLEVEPERVTVVQEYPTQVLLDMEFVKSFYNPGMPPRHIVIGIPKGAMLCGDVKLKRLSDGIILCGEEVGHYDWV
ncbi:MAG: hypothetical protein SPL56_09610 [Lachnospiraceae bacterium]|nr:hypothetical protein [Lachnospiraceae bacterium]